MTKSQKAEAKVKRAAQLIEWHAIVVKGSCPSCGTKLYRNNSLAGWWPVVGKEQPNARDQATLPEASRTGPNLSQMPCQ